MVIMVNHVPSRNQVISFPLTTPFYSFGLCRGKGPLNNFSFGLVFIIYLIKFLFCIFILYPLCITIKKEKKRVNGIMVIFVTLLRDVCDIIKNGDFKFGTNKILDAL